MTENLLVKIKGFINSPFEDLFNVYALFKIVLGGVN